MMANNIITLANIASQQNQTIKKYNVVQDWATFLMLIYEQMSNKKVVVNKWVKNQNNIRIIYMMKY